MSSVTVIGGGLAGCEAALQLSARGFSVRLIEMRPERMTPAHRSSMLAELVCSNSLKSVDPETASGLLKAELKILGCRLLSMAEKASVPAGHALAVDRDMFSAVVGGAVGADKRIILERNEQKDLDIEGPCVIATGPLTSDDMSRALRKHFESDDLYFYDAISISVGIESLDHSRLFKASRYGKGEADYWNVPFSREEYEELISFLKNAPKTEKRGFEEGRCFEACLPVEVTASRGDDTLRFGPMKPKGLKDPATGKEPYAVLQLRQETSGGEMVGLVGFQTRLTRGAQRKLMRIIPGFESAEILRWGAIHRNTYLDAPRLLDGRQMSKAGDGLFFAGQIAGVEGYMESIAHGLVVALNVEDYLSGRNIVLFPEETIVGGLQRHMTEARGDYQPMNANFGILPPVSGRRRDRKRKKAERSLEAIRSYVGKRAQERRL